MVTRSQQLHLQSIAENQSNTFDLFITERVVNLSNLFNDPKFNIPPVAEDMQGYLTRLQKNSPAFTDVGFFDSSGVQIAYSGPYPSLEKLDYSTEAWYMDLMNRDSSFIITDIYLGLRNRPHFTIAIKRTLGKQVVVLRTSLDPERVYAYITSLKGSQEVSTSIVNHNGLFQLVRNQLGMPLDSSFFLPARQPALGIAETAIDEGNITYAYSWLKTADWALIVQDTGEEKGGLLSGYRLQIILIFLILTVLISLMVYYRAGRLVEFQKETDRTRAQLEHAAKLASVGELAAGIAHEINNPLAVINEETGLMKDLLSAEYGDPADPQKLIPNLDNIHEAVFRCRDVTRKLLGFVRKTDLDISSHDVHKLIDNVVDGILGKELEVSNIEIVRDYASNIPLMQTDANQLQQVLLNLLNNANDALQDKPGRITIRTVYIKKKIQVMISDTGIGMTRNQIDKIFLPFYTTKEVGKGTGLGLSVSYGIIKNMGGKIEAESVPGEGQHFHSDSAPAL